MQSVGSGVQAGRNAGRCVRLVLPDTTEEGGRNEGGAHKVRDEEGGEVV